MVHDAATLGLTIDDAPRSRTIEGRGRANRLTGSEWVKNSISLWSDIRKSESERRRGHPAIFPEELVRRVIQCFMPPDGKVLLDPFAGTGAAPVAADRMGLIGIGIEVTASYAAIAEQRLLDRGMFDGEDTRAGDDQSRIYQLDARRVADVLRPESVDLVMTSPPYWDVLSQRRTADNRAIRDYEGVDGDLSRISDYGTFVDELAGIFGAVWRVMKPKAYCIVNVMDLRKGDRFFPFHSDLARALAERGFIFDDIIIWDRRHEYNNFRALGYPSVFRINKAHEYLLIFQKPRP